MVNNLPQLNVAVLLYDGVDLLDAGGPYEVFLTASRLMRRDGLDGNIQLVTFTLDGKPATAYGGLGLIPHSSADALSEAHLLIVPGTIAIDEALQNQAIIQAIKDFAQSRSAVTASVCTGAFLLAEAGLLNHVSWTTHWEDMQQLIDKLGTGGARFSERWVDSGHIVTSGGLACGIDMALHLINLFYSKALAERTARQLDFTMTASSL